MYPTNQTEEQKIAEINKYRKANDLPLLKLKDRKCLNCNSLFKSTHKRICDSCTKEMSRFGEYENG